MLTPGNWSKSIGVSQREYCKIEVIPLSGQSDMNVRSAPEKAVSDFAEGNEVGINNKLIYSTPVNLNTNKDRMLTQSLTIP